MSEFPASFAQELLWNLDRASAGLSAYNIPRARRLRGPLDLAALEQALAALVERHEILRTTYAERDGAVVQIVHPAASLPLEVVNLSALPLQEREREVARLLRERSTAPFDLGRDSLLRRLVIRLGDGDHILLLVTHHIASDGWSGTVMQRDLFAFYQALQAGRTAMLAELPIQYGDFAAWQRDELQGARLEILLRFWREQLKGDLSSLELPTDRPRSSTPSYDGDHRVLELPASLADQLRRLGQRSGASLYMVLLAAYQTLLHRLSGQDEVLVGSPVAGRDRPETEGLIGYFANTLVYRAGFADDPTFEQLLTRVRDSCLGAFEHHEMPLERLMLDLSREGRLPEGSLFRVVFTQLDTSPKHLALGGLSIEPETLSNDTVKFDLTLFMADHPDRLRLVLYFRTELFDAQRIERILGEFRTLLTGIVADPARPVSRLPLLPAEELEQLAGWNRPAHPLNAPSPITALISAAAARRPDEAAVVAGEATLSWAELLTRASRLARCLQAQGVGPDVVVGLCLERSAELMVGMLGILLAGGAYLPLLPDLPPARLAQQLGTSGAALVVTREAHRARLPAGVATICLDTDHELLARQAGTPPVSAATPASLAYVLFTSGSTGVPKGVAVTHANLAHYTGAIAAVLGLELGGGQAPWHGASVSTLAADLGHTAVFPILASGGTLHLLAEALTLEPARFQAYLAEHPIDLLKITPSHFQALAGPDFQAAHLPARWLVLGGEPCPWALVDAVRARGRCRVLNHYGPTETTVGATTFEPGIRDVSRWAPATVPIGLPLPHMTADVLDAREQLVPPGVAGELWLGGSGVARGYLGAAALTAERFKDQHGIRRYRTGDRVRRLPTGDLEFLGRLDTQVKVRGHRVELGEIEAVLAGCPGVRQAVVALREETLVAYVVEAAPVPTESLVAHVASVLPDHMVPGEWMRLASLPLTPNGKVDRAALPAPLSTAAAVPGDGGPVTETERALADLWAEVLKKEPIGRDVSFFALGGHSLLAIRLLGKIAKRFGIRLPLRTLFDNSTVGALAARLDLELGLAAVESMSDEDAERMLAAQKQGERSP